MLESEDLVAHPVPRAVFVRVKPDLADVVQQREHSADVTILKIKAIHGDDLLGHLDRVFGEAAGSRVVMLLRTRTRPEAAEHIRHREHVAYEVPQGLAAQLVGNVTEALHDVLVAACVIRYELKDLEPRLCVDGGHDWHFVSLR